MKFYLKGFIFFIFFFPFYFSESYAENINHSTQTVDYASLVDQHIEPLGEKVIIVDPIKHVWAAYDAQGQLLRAGLATTGSHWCPDLGRPCRTAMGKFRIKSLGGPACKSSQFPKPYGGAPMPYCMFFNKGQALHGSPASQVRPANLSHGCVRLRIEDAEWIRYDFASVGTLVIIKPYL